MQLGKYITNLGVLSALIGAFGVVKQTSRMPNDWRRYLIWATWLLGVVMAIATVAKDVETTK